MHKTHLEQLLGFIHSLWSQTYLAGNQKEVMMTPRELAVLFSSHVLAFALVWFTNFVENIFTSMVPAAKWHSVPPSQKKEVVYNEPSSWNVATFFGLDR